MNDPILVSEEYILVIDTDQYTGHFAEELCAYCTGYYGEKAGDKVKDISDVFYLDHGIADDEGSKGFLAEDKNPLRGYVTDHQDEDGFWTPVAVWPSRLYGANAEGNYGELTESNYETYNFPAGFSLGIYFAEEPHIGILQKIRSRAETYFRDFYPKMEEGSVQVNVKGYRLIVHRKTAEERPV